MDPTDQEAVTASHLALSDAEDRLNVYRTALHGRLAEATSELITRYAKTPEACLDLLYANRAKPPA